MLFSDVNKVVILIISGLIIVISSCGPAAKLRRAEKLISKAEEMGAVWHVDTVYQMTPVEIESVRVDSVIVALPGDTVTIEKDRLKVKYVRLPGDSVFIEGECKGDTIYKAVPVTVTKTITAKGGIQWWWLLVAVAGGMILGAIVRLVK